MRFVIVMEFFYILSLNFFYGYAIFRFCTHGQGSKHVYEKKLDVKDIAKTLQIEHSGAGRTRPLNVKKNVTL